jgi:hypothetical protein
MKSSLKITLTIVAIVILAGIIFFFRQRGPHLPHTRPPHAAGTYITKSRLVFAGYATPEAALESMTWAMMNGDYDTSIASLGPEMRADAVKDPKDRKNFESSMRKMSTRFKGMQIVAKKTLAGDKVELKLKLDVALPSNSHGDVPPFFIQPMTRFGNEWKLGGSTRGYETNWDQSGQIQTFVQ